jgi:hypothetical protein
VRTSVILLAAAVVLVTPAAASAGDCEELQVWRDGSSAGRACRSDAVSQGLVVIDLGDDWVPPVLAPAPDGAVSSYRATYLALAQERFADAGSDGELARDDRYLELFGVEPTLGVVHARLADAARHRCHAAIDDTPLRTAPARIVEEGRAEAVARIAHARALRDELEYDQRRAQLPDLEALAARDAYHRRELVRLTALEGYIAAVRVTQAHLTCDGLVASRPIDGGFTWQTSNALATFQRGVTILPTGILDKPTRDELVRDSRERDLRTALRVLRERVIGASGVIEDGTAANVRGTVLGRELDPDGTWRVRGHEALEGAAPDLVAAATDAAARALGWHDPDSVQAFLELTATPEARTRFVAVTLPTPPRYHVTPMELSIEIDRGDVWHDPVPRWRDVRRRPALIAYVRDGDHRVPLVRWPTTIGGWQAQQLNGDIEKKWKESPVGPRLWRDVYVGPRWLPPKTTPDRELMRSAGDRYVLAREQLGPSYRAAFGMVAFVHLVEEHERTGTVLEDQGIRTHGTGNLASLASGVSHGCHRLLGIEAIRLAGFVLAHHEVIWHGATPTSYHRVVEYRGRFPISIDSLGDRIELVPPISVEVLPGRIHR